MKNLLIFGMTKLPDFLMPQYRALYGNNVRCHVIEAQKTFLKLIHSLHTIFKCSMSLRYFYVPEDNPGEQLSIYLLLRYEPGTDTEKIRQIIKKSPINAFYPFSGNSAVFSECDPDDIDNDILDPSIFKYATEGIKEEETYQPMFRGKPDAKVDSQLRNSPYQAVPYYVIHSFEPVEENDMTFIDKQFLTYHNRMLVEITIKPTEITNEETLAITRIIGELEKITSSRSISINTSICESPSIEKDLLAEMAQDKFEEMQELLHTGRCFEFALRVFGDDQEFTTAMAHNLLLAGNKNGRYRLFCFSNHSEEHKLICKASLECTPTSTILWNDFWDCVPEGYDVFHLIKYLSRKATLEEIAPYFRLPIPGTEPLMTIPTTNEFTIKEDANCEHPPVITLGHETFKPIRKAMVEVKQLCKHMLITGVPGSGKTASIFSLLFQLYCEGIPFLIIEPSKTEYRLLKRLAYMNVAELNSLGIDPTMIEIAQNLGKDLRIYTIGNDLVSPLRFNPFEFPQGIGLYEHMGNVEACFRGAMPINTGPLPALISEAMEEIYKCCGWNGYDIADGSKPFPTMQMLHDKISDIFKTKDYSSDVKGDLKTAIEVRIGNLLRRDIGRIFDTNTSCPDIEELMTSPVILEFDSPNEEHSNLMIMFVLSRLKEYVKATRCSGTPLTHVTVLEEAHNIIGQAENQSNEDIANPKVEATKYVSRFLAEMRALGEGLVIADQLPSAVAPEVIKNTNAKLVHRLLSADDREDIGMTMLMDSIQMEDLARLLPGESYLYQEGMVRPVRINDLYIPKTFPVLGTTPPDDKELIRMLHSNSWWAEGLFIEIVEIIKELETLFNDMVKYVRKIIQINIRLQEKGADKSEFTLLRELVLQEEENFNKRYQHLNNNSVYFIRLMEQRSTYCIESFEKLFRPMLTKVQKMVFRAFRQFDELGM